MTNRSRKNGGKKSSLWSLRNVALAAMVFLPAPIYVWGPVIVKEIRFRLMTEQDQQATLDARENLARRVVLLIQQREARTRLLGQEMVLIPEGEFTMGSDQGSEEQGERPARRVYLPAFEIDKYEVTPAQYRPCVEAGICAKPATYRDSQEPYDVAEKYDFAANLMSWEAASTYCGWVGKRLPTEAEWEKAARGTDGREFPWGNVFPVPPDTAVGNFKDRAFSLYHRPKGKSTPMSGNGPRGIEVDGVDYDDGWVDVGGVGRFRAGASPYGVMDMAGNVAEFVADSYTSGTNKTAAELPPFRGGSWDSMMDEIRTWQRPIVDDPAYHGPARSVGFRCARDPLPLSERAVETASTEFSDEGYYGSLDTAGDVEFIYDSSRIGIAGQFWIHWSYSFTYEHLSRQHEGKTHFSVIPTVNIKSHMKHRIFLPARNTKRFHEYLAKQYDYVAVSTDERPIKLFHRLISQIDTIRFEEEGDVTLNSDVVSPHLKSTVERYDSAVTAVVNYNNNRLAKERQNFSALLLRRNDFFEALYTAENLEEAGFEYLAELGDFLQSSDYVDAKRFHRFTTTEQSIR